MISFGPIPPGRLGKSLGINNIPEQKICSYSCIYCQIGFTKQYSITPTSFYEPTLIYDEVKKHPEKLKEIDKPDYLTFVANGEPTPDVNLGKSIEKLKNLGIPIAVITNASLLHLREVCDNLKSSDWVSVKVDANNEVAQKKINRNYASLKFSNYIESLLKFSSEFKGKLVTETMLIKGINDTHEIIRATSDLIKQINPSASYLSIPTRPPALKTVSPPEVFQINEAFQIFSDAGLHVELILGFEGTDTGYTGNAFEDILNISAVHPIREDTMKELLFKDNADFNIVKSMINNNLIKELRYKSMKFYLRQFHP